MSLQKQSIHHISESLSHAKHTSSLFEIINSPPGLRKIKHPAPQGAGFVFAAYNENVLYCISCLPPEQALGHAFAHARRGDTVCLHRSVIGRLDMRRELEGEQKTVSSLMRLSAITRSAVFCAVRAIVDDERYDSVMAFKSGKLLGVSDRVSPRAGYCCGNSLRCYDLPCGRTGVLVGGDFEYPELWRALSIYDCESCIVFDERKLTALSGNLLSSLSFTAGLTVFAHFYDASVCYAPDGSLKEKVAGECRALDCECESRKPKILNAKPKLYK